MKVVFSGGAEIDAALRELPRRLAKAVTTRSATKALKVFVDAANAKAPVGRTGNLSKSYKVGARSVLTRRQKSQADQPAADEVIVYAGTANPAGQMQEFGTVNHAAQPHARPAWEETRQKVVDSLEQDFAAEVAKTKARAAKRAAKL
jgi:HK97 gp10 family phage protein